MITMPNRLEEIVESLEQGVTVNYEHVALLQTFDLVIAGRQFVEDASKFQEQEDERIRELLTING